MSPLRAVGVEVFELAGESSSGERRNVVGKHPIALDLKLSGFAASVDCGGEAAFGLRPEGFRLKPFLDPDAEKGVPVPPYSAFGGFAFFAFGSPKNPRMSFPSTTNAAS